jgi:hypothetical protein
MANPTHGIRPLITADELGEILRKSPSTILSDLRRAPHRVPPPCTPPGTRRPLWRPEDVEAWLPRPPASGSLAGLLPPTAPMAPAARKKRIRHTPADAATTAALAAEAVAELDASAREQGARTPPPGEPAQPGPEASA